MAQVHTSASSNRKLMTKYEKELLKLANIYQAESFKHTEITPAGFVAKAGDADIVCQIYQEVASDFKAAAAHLTTCQYKLAELKQALRNIKAQKRHNAKKA